MSGLAVELLMGESLIDSMDLETLANFKLWLGVIGLSFAPFNSLRFMFVS